MLANHRRPIKKERPSKHNPRKLKPALPKSINRTTANYPSPPGVEGAPARPTRNTRTGHLSQKQVTGKTDKLHPRQNP